MKSLLSLIFVVICGGSIHAQMFQVGQITAAGAGCVGGNIDLSVDDNGLVLSYPQMKISPNSQKTIDRVSCNIAIPFSLPPGFQLVATAVTNGAAALEKSDRGNVSQELFFAGSTSVVKKAVLKAGSRSFQLASGLAPFRSACGQSLILRNNLNATLIKANSASRAVVSVATTKLAIQVVPCQ